ncbi:MAG TPA: glycoside hydrolase family 15 protein, partial [Pseudomonadales bacterium]|nr:glycoside hydrolase family 15 protein [Pseudomonadales bacterium]
NRLGATGTLERYMQFIFNLIAELPGECLQPVYALNGAPDLTERIVSSLAGYRRMQPVRVGNQAYEQIQHDVYGAAILGVAHAFFDVRMRGLADESAFLRLEPLGERAWEVHELPDAGIWELRGSKHIHTFSVLMCWAACDRLARIAHCLNKLERAQFWQARAEVIHAKICQRAWSEEKQAFVASFGGRSLDASVLLMTELKFLPPDDSRLRSSIERIGTELKSGRFLLRYRDKDDFGYPENAFVVCTFWYVQALAYIGEKQRARDLFEEILAFTNKFGLLSEDISPETGELWGNYPQTYSLVGVISCAAKLSTSWEDAF